jgi:hypothetical protein
MASKSPQPKARDGVVSTLDVAIELLNLGRVTCSISPAQVAFGSVGVLLTIIRVCCLLFCGGELPVDVYPGHDDQGTGLPRTGVELCRRV